MMMWRKKKPSSPSPSHSSSSSSILNLSWLSKIKKTKKNFARDPEKGEVDVGCKGIQMPMSWKNGKFYGGDHGSDWRLSFGEENYGLEKSGTGLKSVWYDSEDENQEHSSRMIDVAEREEVLKFNQMVSNIRKLKESPHSGDRKNREFKGKKRKSEKDWKLEKGIGGDLQEKKLAFGNKSNLVVQGKEEFRLKPLKSNFETIEEEYMLEALSLNKERLDSEWKKLKEIKLKEFMKKSEIQRKSIYISTEPNMKTMRNSSKTRAYSPRTAYKIECKIKAIEDMKRAKKKLRNKPGFDSCAVVKSSFDPQSDFKKSMVEMITVKGITKAQELEELLACYLTLNADVYHDTIIKVFRQVWFELIQDHLTPAI